MRPVSLVIEGLTSFSERQVVDFSELDLFVITGPTGAGKSSILDAMTFALYGKVARVNSSELRDLISHGSADMRVQLDFKVDGTEYRVARRMGRTRHDVTLERIVDGTPITELDRGGTTAVTNRLEEIIGLDFGAFTKAVLLPQGAFHEFLKGDRAERRRILTRLLDLTRYERAGQVARGEARRLEAIVGEREGLIDSNYRDATKEQLAELKKTAKEAGERWKKLQEARDEGKKIAKEAERARQSVTALTETLVQLEEARSKLQELAGGWSPLELESQTTKEAVAKAGESLSEAKKELGRAREKLASTKNRTGDSALLAQLEAAATAFSDGRQELARHEAELRTARQEATSLTKALRAAERDDLERTRVLENATKARQQAETDHLTAKAVAQSSQRNAVLVGIDEQLKPAQERAETTAEQAMRASEKIAHLEQEHAAVALRVGLGPGDSCPVCRSIIETIPKTDKNLEALLARASEARDKAEAHARDAKDDLVGLRARHRSAAEELEKTRAMLPKKIDVPSTDEATRSLAEAEKRSAAALREEAKAQGALERSTQHLSRLKAKDAGVTERVSGLVSKSSDANERLEAAKATLVKGFAGKLPREVDAALVQRRAALGAAEDECNQASDKLDRAREARDAAQIEATAVAERVSTFESVFATARTAASIAFQGVARKVEEGDLPIIPHDTDGHSDLLTSWCDCCDGHITSAKAVIGLTNKEVVSASTKLRELAIQAGMVVTTDEQATMERQLEESATAAHRLFVAAERDVETVKGRIKQRKQMEKAIVDDRRDRALYEALARELRADHFVAWVLEESMTQLADQATIELLRISSGRYSLVADDGNFDVVDHHNADERRSVATLSGGETFLASLSLALALAAGLRELAGTSSGRLDAIYIDEGFGALDPETLDVVVDALERLREGDRMVGVITHVPMLAERIPVGLLVETNGGSSRIVPR